MAIDELYSDLVGTGTNAQALRDALYANGAEEAFKVQTHVIDGQTIVARVRSDLELTIEIQSVNGVPYNPATHDSFFAEPNANASDGNPLTRAFVDRPTPEQTVAVNAPATSASISNGPQANAYLQGLVEFLGGDTRGVDNTRKRRDGALSNTDKALAKVLDISETEAAGLSTSDAIARLESAVKGMGREAFQNRLTELNRGAIVGQATDAEYAMQAAMMAESGDTMVYDGKAGSGTRAFASNHAWIVTPGRAPATGGSAPAEEPETPEDEEPETPEDEEPETPEDEEPETPEDEEPEADAPVYVLKAEADSAVINIQAEDGSETAVKDITFDDLKDLSIEGAPERIKGFLRLMVKDGTIDTGLKEQISDVLVAAGLDSAQIQAIRDSLKTDYDAQTDAAIDAELNEVDALIADRASRPGQDLYEAFIAEMKDGDDDNALVPIIEMASIEVGPGNTITGIDAVYLMLGNRTPEELQALFRPEDDENSSNDLSRAMVAFVLRDGTAPDAYVNLRQSLETAYINIGYSGGISEGWMLDRLVAGISNSAEIPNVISGMKAVFEDAGEDFNSALKSYYLSNDFSGMRELYQTSPQFVAQFMDKVELKDPEQIKSIFQKVGIDSLEEYDAFLAIQNSGPVKDAVQGLRDDFAKSNKAIFPDAPKISIDFNTTSVTTAQPNTDNKFNFIIIPHEETIVVRLHYKGDDGKWWHFGENEKYGLDLDLAADRETAEQIQAAIKDAVYDYLGIDKDKAGQYNAQRMAALKELAVDHTTFSYDDTAEGMLHEILEDIEDSATYTVDAASVKPAADAPKSGPARGGSIRQG